MKQGGCGIIGIFILFFLGAVLIMVSVSNVVGTLHLIKSGVAIEGKIVSYVQHYESNHGSGGYYVSDPVIEFQTADQKTIQFESTEATNAKTGTTVPVLYDPSFPQNARINAFFTLWDATIFLSIFGVIGLMICVSIGFFIVPIVIQNEKKKKLLLIGQKFEANFKEITKKRTINNKTLYQIVCDYADGAETKLFISFPLWYDPSSYIKSTKIAVFIDPYNPKNYFVDTSFSDNPPNTNGLNPNSSNLENPKTKKQIHLLLTANYVWETTTVITFIYIASVLYKNLQINGINYGFYLKPIAAISPFFVIALNIGVHYFFQNVQTNTRISKEIEKDIDQDVEKITDDPFKNFLNYFWKSIKVTIKNFIIGFLCLIPLSIVFSFIQIILTGQGNGGFTFSF